MNIVNNYVNTTKNSYGLLGHSIQAPKDLATLLLSEADIKELLEYYDDKLSSGMRLRS